MAKISGKETKPEIFVRKFLFNKGLRYRKNVTSLPGKPDIVLAKHKTIVFIHGCFWHGHINCKASKLPTNNYEFWREKLKRNAERDRQNIEELEQQGWKVLVVWQCDIKSKKKSIIRLEQLYEEIVSNPKV